MKKLFLTTLSLITCSNLHAQTEVKRIFSDFKKMPAQSKSSLFNSLLGKSFSCTEYRYQKFNDSFAHYKTTLEFRPYLSNEYANTNDQNYLEFAEYKRTQIISGINETYPRFGCEGIEWGVTWSDYSKQASVSIEVYTIIPNSNITHCEPFVFKTTGNKLVAAAQLVGEPIQVMECLRK